MMTTRRSFLAGVGAATWLPVAGLLQDPASRALPVSAYFFLTSSEGRLLEAACARIFGDRRDVRVVHYIDRQLAGPWGSGAQVYRSGVWQSGIAPPSRNALCPAALCRTALAAIDCECFERQTPFVVQPPDVQDGFLRAMAANRVELRGIASAEFFSLLLQLTVEGYLVAVGSRRDRVSWRMMGFPGAIAIP